MAVDKNAIKWVGTSAGLCRFDNTNWQTWSIANSNLPDNSVLSVAVDTAGTVWTATANGAAKLVGSVWTVFHAGAGLPSNRVNQVAIDRSGVVWFSTDAGLASLNGATWTVYTTANGLPSNLVFATAFDLANVKWIATAGGMARFDGTAWTSFTTANSSIPQSNVSSVLVDDFGNKWVGTIEGGLGIYQLGGIQGVTAVWQPCEQTPALSSNAGTTVRLSRSSGGVAIGFSVAQPGMVTISICDLAGRTVWNHREIYPAGYHHALWNRDANSRPGTYAVLVGTAGAVQRAVIAAGIGL